MSAIPPEFLAEPAPNIDKNIIDFRQTSLPEYEGLYAVVLDNVLTRAECQALIDLAESQTNGQWARAMVNAAFGQDKLYPDYRNSGRIMWDSEEMVARIWKRCKPLVPEILSLEDRAAITGPNPVRLGEVWQLNRLNERMRFLKYENGEFFRRHKDAAYHSDDGEQSFFTLHLYLNDSESPGEEALGNMESKEHLSSIQSELQGGATTFHSARTGDRLDIAPKTGRVLIFQQRQLIHSGDDVLQGVKYTMRTDIMYRLAEK